MDYQQILEPGKKLSESGDELKVRIDGVPVSKEEGLKDGKTFNVIVVYESTEIQYDENGEPLSAEKMLTGSVLLRRPGPLRREVE